MPDDEGELAVTLRQLETVRATLETLKLDFKETDVDGLTYIKVDLKGPDRLASLHLVHGGGLVVIYGLFGVRVQEPSRREELLRFANIFNAANRCGCLLARDDGSVVYRNSVDYSKVKDLEQGYVAALVESVLELGDAIDVPLILIAKGKSAHAALTETWESIEPLPFAAAK